MASSGKDPLYDQLAHLLRDKIDNEMNAGDLLPSERELSQQFGLSRTTVRLALQELEKIGVIERIHGKGTFVAQCTSNGTNLSESYSFTEQMKSLGRVPQTNILNFEIIEANKFIAKGLHLPIWEKVIHLKRLRLADNIPMMIEESYLPRSLFPFLSEAVCSKKPLYTIIEQDYAFNISVAEEEFSASLASNYEARDLSIPENSAVLRLTRQTFTDTGQIVEFTRSVARADLFKYKVTLYKSNHSNRLEESDV